MQMHLCGSPPLVRPSVSQSHLAGWLSHRGTSASPPSWMGLLRQKKQYLLLSNQSFLFAERVLSKKFALNILARITDNAEFKTFDFKQKGSLIGFVKMFLLSFNYVSRSL